ncbi:cAMP-binding domain of CRP or a regulatory subunit of cAMP-dependent protein kinases [Chitinophaga sp. CF118]|uniref:Crp/Fnr family transcriptional regulator n=1 Tax=Chitinophaga sp. CF118 TaxID=1884367 RepID=UPI0008EF7B88|nr:Crp/Fnr family transcriptional regulator [Chitinophaga sp. CF118]SFE09119.1 cAMP-binding domain of CRP or a regulatory subunit of cAMP-dependent protein kinases [Chitinophaga sp. CF118]
MYPALRKHFENLVQLTDAEFEYISSFFQVKQFKKHSIILQPGDIVHYEYFVLKGLIKTFMIDNSGKEHIWQFAMEEWWVSDYYAFQTGGTSSFTVQCLEDVELLCISFADRDKLCLEIHSFERFCRLKITAGFFSQQKRIMALLQNDAQSRYQQLLEQYPSLFQRVPKALIAGYLGVSRETLSRLRIE